MSLRFGLDTVAPAAVFETLGDNPNSNQLGLSAAVVSIGVNFTRWTVDEGADEHKQASTRAILQLALQAYYYSRTHRESLVCPGLRVDNGAVFFMNPMASPIVEPGEDVVVAQLTVAAGTTFLGSMNAQGKTWCANWDTDPSSCGSDWAHDV